MLAKDVMSSPVHTVPPTASLDTAAAVMTKHSVTALAVVDGAGRLVGMVSEGDLLRDRVPPGPGAHLRRESLLEPVHPALVGEVMSAFPLTVTPEVDLTDVAGVMTDNDVRSLPVMAGGGVVGIISRRDILRGLAPPGA